MRSNVVFLLIMLVASVSVILDGFVFNKAIEGPINVFSFSEATFADLAVVHAMMIGMLCLVGLVIIKAEHSVLKARKNPLVIEIRKDTLIGRWNNQKDVLIGAPFSSENSLVSNADVLIKGMNQILNVIKKEKGGSKAHRFVALCPKKTEKQVFSDDERAILECVIECSEFRSGAIFEI